MSGQCVRIPSGVRLLCLRLTSRPSLRQLPVGALPDALTRSGDHVAEISPDKNMNFRRTTGPFTVCIELQGFVVLRPLAPCTRPLMAFLFVSSRLRHPTSFPPNLTITQLSLAHAFVFIVLCTKDFHLISSCPCRAYTCALMQLASRSSHQAD